jgi:hypothetical protein
MDPDLQKAIVESLMPLIVGTVVCLFAFRIVGKKPGQDPRWDRWHDDWGRMPRVFGPAILVYGIIMIALRYLKMA